MKAVVHSVTGYFGNHLPKFTKNSTHTHRIPLTLNVIFID